MVMQMISFMGGDFVILLKKNPNNIVKGSFRKKIRIIATFQGKKYEYVNFFGGFWQISSFLLLKFGHF
jgi:hypothetical protein